MTFWIRHIALLILCVVIPLGAALYFDTQSEVGRAQRAGATAAQISERSLSQRLRLEGHQSVQRAMTVARAVTEANLFDELESRYKNRQEAAVEKVQKLLAEATPKGGFTWLIDDQGRIIWKNGQTEPNESPRSIVGHPVFTKTQLGMAFDAVWHEGGVSMIGAAPVTKDGAAFGAAIIGRPIDSAMLAAFSKELGMQLTLVSDNAVVATTLDPEFAKTVAPHSSMQPAHGGRLAQPLRTGNLAPFLPVLVDKHASGLAFTSVAHKAPARNVRWIVSVPSAEPLQDLALRQEILLGVLAASLMLALLVGMVNFRTFVSPVKRVEEHLSNIQLGRGEVELPEGRVSRPFRRLVRLVNMTVQKMPTRSYGSSSSLHDSPISELPAPAAPDPTGDLVLSPGPGLSLGEDPVAAAMAAPKEPPADISQFPAAPEPTPPPPPPPADNIAALGGHRGVAASPQSQEDEAAAIAEAIASLEAQQAEADGLSSPPSPKSASDIRGGVPSMESPFTPSQSEYFRAGSQTSGAPSADGEAYMPPEGAAETGAGLRGGGSLSLDSPAGLGSAHPPSDDGFSPESTVVAPVQEDLLAKSARGEFTGEHQSIEEAKPDATVVASVPADLLAQTAGEAQPESPAPSDPHGLDAADHAHFKQVYERFIEMRRKCGEATADLAFDRFLSKLTKNRENLIKKYNCRTVRFQVYEKDGKAALKATPVRAR